MFDINNSNTKMCSADCANGKIRSYISSLEARMGSIDKNFKQMDFKNANARDEMEIEINEMLKKCQARIDALKKVRF